MGRKTWLKGKIVQCTYSPIWLIYFIWYAPHDKSSLKQSSGSLKLTHTDVYFIKWNNIINDWREYKQRLALWSNIHKKKIQNLFNIFWLMDKYSIWSMLDLQVETIFPFPCLSFLNSFTKNSSVFKSSLGTPIKFISSIYVVNIGNQDSDFFTKTLGYII